MQTPKEVFFNKVRIVDEFCPTCINSDALETEDPCNECLRCESNTDSDKPKNYIHNS